LFVGLGHDFVALPSVPNAWIAGIGATAALAAHQADGSVNGDLQHTGDFFQAGDPIGNAGVQLAGATAVYVIGRWTHSPRPARIGMDLLRAQALAGSMSLAIKVSVQRERPDGRNFSFPSGHTAVTVASMTVLCRRLGWAWALPLYGTGAYVAMSRLHDNQHWLSDVVFGAAVGGIAGRTVTRDRHSRYALVPVYTPARGIAVLVTRTS